jgi:hypothetical protein
VQKAQCDIGAHSKPQLQTGGTRLRQPPCPAPTLTASIQLCVSPATQGTYPCSRTRLATTTQSCISISGRASLRVQGTASTAIFCGPNSVSYWTLTSGFCRTHCCVVTPTRPGRRPCFQSCCLAAILVWFLTSAPTPAHALHPTRSRPAPEPDSH